MLGNPSFVTSVTVADSYFSGSHYIGGICGSAYTYPISYCKNYAIVCGSGANNGDAAYVGGICGEGGQLSHCENHGLVTGSGKRVGGICGSSATVSDCKNFGAVQGDVDYVGGIVGYSTKSISNSENHGAVQGKAEYVGGIAGYSTGSDTSVKNCSNFSHVQGDKAMVGGIVGQNSSATVENCTNKSSAPVTGGDQFTGGIVGQNTESGKVTGCQNEATVTDHKIVGGIVGYNYKNAQVSGCTNTGNVTASYQENSSGAWIGGIVGELETGTVTGCDSSGIIKGTSSVGGIVGHIMDSGTIQTCKNSGTVTGCNSDGETTGNNTDVGGICGDNMGGTVTGCENNGGAVKGYSDVGGICGRSYKNCTISGCKNSGEVTGDTSVGGICGKYEYSVSNNKINVTNCENSGKVRGRIEVGGVCGLLSQGTITRCVNTGEITGDNGSIGGICGSTSGNNYTVTISESYNTGSVVSYSGYNTGGICGYFKINSNCSIDHCYNSASVSGVNTVGGICGNAVGSADIITNCYYLDTNTLALGNKGKDAQGTSVQKTVEQFASGEVAYLLNGSTFTGTLVWYQYIDAGTRDESPKFTGGTVYKVYEGSPCPGYTNNEDYTTTPRNHNIVSHTCTVCGYQDQFPIIVSGITAKNKTYDGDTTAELDTSNMVLTGKQNAYPNVSVSATGTFDNANVGTGKTVTITLDLTGDNAEKYYLAESGQQTEATASITAKDITVTITPNGGTYGNVTPATAKLNDLATGDNVPVTLTYSGTANDGTVANGTNKPTQAGTYTVTASISNSNYKLIGTNKADFKIEKATVTTPTIPSKEYTGQPLTADVPTSNLYTVERNEGGTDVNASGYPVELKLTDDKNYQWDNAGGQTSFEITKAANEWTDDPAITGWTYGENASNPTLGTAKFGTAQVTYLKDETVLDTVPTNAGSYTARFTVDETTNYAGLTKDVSFTISPKPVTVSGITAGDKTYDGNTTATLNYNGVTFTGKLDGDSLTVSGTGTFTDANVGSDKTVNITALTLGGDSEDNYTLATEGQQTQTQATISKANSSVTKAPEDAKSLYNGGNVQLITEGTAAGGTMQYSLDGVTWSADIPTATDWKTYTVYYKVVGDNNHNNTEAQSLTAEIVPFKIAGQPVTVTTSYGDSPRMYVDLTTQLSEQISYQWYQVTDEGDVELTDATESTLTILKPIAGEYTYVCKITCGDYFKYSDPITVTVNPAQVENVNLSGYWAEGGEREIAQSETIELTNPSSRLLTKYTTKTNDQGGEYPTGMQVFKLDENNQPEEIPALENLLQYSGCSIRINGKPGIRMITSLTKEAKELLKKGELAGYTLEEYGTVVAWDVGADMQLPLTLGNGNKHNYAYKKGVSDPVFSNVDNLTQYTNVLVWDSLTDAQLAQDILMRPYIILSKDDGKTVTLYGGTVSRSIGYVAQQNADTFPKGSAGYNYVHDIIDRVEKYKQNSGSTTTPGG